MQSSVALGPSLKLAACACAIAWLGTAAATPVFPGGSCTVTATPNGAALTGCTNNNAVPANDLHLVFNYQDPGLAPLPTRTASFSFDSAYAPGQTWSPGGDAAVPVWNRAEIIAGTQDGVFDPNRVSLLGSYWTRDGTPLVPIPAPLALVAGGIAMLAGFARRGRATAPASGA